MVEIVFAVVKQQVKVTLLIGENKTENMFNIGDTLILPMPNPINGKVFKHWLIDGIKYSAGASLMVNSNINVVAEFTENWKVVTVIDETEKIEYYENKAIITLSPTKNNIIVWCTHRQMIILPRHYINNIGYIIAVITKIFKFD